MPRRIRRSLAWQCTSVSCLLKIAFMQDICNQSRISITSIGEPEFYSERTQFICVLHPKWPQHFPWDKWTAFVRLAHGCNGSIGVLGRTLACTRWSASRQSRPSLSLWFWTDDTWLFHNSSAVWFWQWISSFPYVWGILDKPGGYCDRKNKSSSHLQKAAWSRIEAGQYDFLWIPGEPAKTRTRHVTVKLKWLHPNVFGFWIFKISFQIKRNLQTPGSFHAIRQTSHAKINPLLLPTFGFSRPVFLWKFALYVTQGISSARSPRNNCYLIWVPKSFFVSRDILLENVTSSILMIYSTKQYEKL